MAGWLHGVFVGDWLFVFPLCGFSLSLFCNYFSSLDLTSGYHQLGLQASEWPKTAFHTHVGKFEWRVLPYALGLTNAPAVFQTATNMMFGRHVNKFVCVYLDDILIFVRAGAFLCT